MMDNQYNPYAFISSDIVAWNGLITAFGSVSHLVCEGDSLRIASEDEEKTHKNSPDKSPLN